MTLLRQLILVIVTLFILLFAGTFAISVHNTRAYLSEQLKTISQDTATSLGVTLSPHFAEGGDIAGEALPQVVDQAHADDPVHIRLRKLVPQPEGHQRQPPAVLGNAFVPPAGGVAVTGCIF